MDQMNKESAFERDDTLIVIDRSAHNRRIAVGAAIAIVVILIIAGVLMRSVSPQQAQPSATAQATAGGQIPSVSIVVPGRSQVTRTVSASGALAARRDQPVGVAGEGGEVTAVLVDAGSWVREGQILA